VPPVLCDYCESSDHAAYTCPFRAYVDATYASVEKKINELTNKMIENLKVRIAEYSQCINQSRKNCNKPNSRLGSPKPEVSLSDDFEPSYQSRPHSHDDLSLPSLEKESNLLVFLLPDLTPEQPPCVSIA